MNMNKTTMALAIGLACASTQAQDTTKIEEVTVIGKNVSYANNAVSDEMIKQQSTMTSVLAVIDNLPGVLINEGDTFGADDWSTTVSIRGFQLSLDEQQIGITVDGIANGNSNYGGGAKANRFVDTENLRGVEVSQGTADIASRSNEALGGTLNFTTINPADEQQLTVSLSQGKFESSKVYVRVDTGEFMPDSYAWLSVSSTESSDFMQQSAQNTRDHFAAKLISEKANTQWTAYISYDDTHEDNYQRVTAGEFNQNDEWDRLTSDWTGVPYVDQLYRQGWSTLRENLFAYLQADTNVGGVDISANIYYHDNEGRGDWVPPYIVDVTNDGSAGHSELVSGNTVRGGSILGQLFFVDGSGNSLTPNAGCVSSITFPYGGAGANYDPACYGAGAIPVGSYRHTHYEKERLGFNVDFAWETTINDNITNTLRGGLWIEDYERNESRDWHKIIDSRTSYYFDHSPYWVQYEREYPVETQMMYLEDTIDTGMLTARLGVKQFDVDLERKDLFADTALDVSSDSDTLLSAGLVIRLPAEGLQVFAGYAENFAAIKDEVLERDASALDNIEPETAENIDLGLRYQGDRLNASIAFYQIDFENRLTFIAPGDADGIDYLIGTNGSYVNTGGIESDGIEASLTYLPNDNWTIYASYTDNSSEYASGTVGFPKGNTVFGSVEDMMVLSLDWQNDVYGAGLSTKWVGDRWIDPANTERAEAYVVSDFYAVVNLGDMGSVKNLQARVTINNLFDESYIGGVAGGWGGWIGAPRTTAFNISASF